MSAPSTFFRKNLLRHKGSLLITYALFSVEMLGVLMRPYFLGEAVNGLILHNYRGLIAFLMVHFAWMIVGTIRMRYDTRTYTNIYNSLVLNFLNKRNLQENLSKLSAHSTLTRELIDFLEYDLVFILDAIYSIIGSMVMMYFYEPSIVLVCLILLIPVVLMSRVYGKKMIRLNKNRNDELENQVDVISSKNPETIKRHYKRLRNWQIRISDQQAFNFGFMEIIVMVILGVSLLLSVKQQQIAILAGDLIGIYNYLLKFITGLDTIPYSVEKYATLKDIINRIDDEETVEV